jgi:lipopolysaccharide transport system ATP-binding protein
VQFDEPQVIVFGVRDNMGIGTARGDWAGDMPGVIRPLLKWDTQVSKGDALGGQARQRS